MSETTALALENTTEENATDLVFPNTGSSPFRGVSIFSDFGRFIGNKEHVEELRRQLNGKRILNLGSSRNGYLSGCVRDLAPGSHVVNLDPVDLCGPANQTQVRGVAQRLPFKDGSFDMTISTWCFPLLWDESLRVPHIANNQHPSEDDVLRDLEIAALELGRVMLRGGQVWMSPFQASIEPETFRPIEGDEEVKQTFINTLAGGGLRPVEFRRCTFYFKGQPFHYEAGIFEKTS